MDFMMGIIVVGAILGIILIIPVGGILAIMIIIGQGKIKKTAWQLVDDPNPDPHEMREAIKKLGLVKNDSEAQSLSTKLMARLD